MLENYGCRVDVASNGHEALSRLETAKYDLVFMDCQMPIMDGFEATRLIREKEKNGEQKTRIIALTAHVLDDDRKQCLAAGMDDYLSKPFRMQELLTMLERWIGAPPAKASPSAPEVARAEVPGAQTSEAEPACLDLRVLDNIRSLSGLNGRKMLAAVIGIYISDSPALMEKLGKSLEAGDAGGMAKAAHALKSTSGNLGAVCLAEICKKVETIAWTNSIEGTTDLISQIRTEYERVQTALEGELQRGI